MSEGEEGTAVKLALLERDLNDQRTRADRLAAAVEKSNELLMKASRRPPTLEVHDGVGHVACPNCDTAADVQLPAAAPAFQTFDEVITLLDSPHREAGGKSVKDCPSCRPKFEAKLKELGYGPLAPITPEE